MPSIRQDEGHGAAEPDRAGGATPAEAGLPRFLSIVVPAKNEAAALPQLVDEVERAFDALRGRPADRGNPLAGYELLIVDDGSTDESPRVLAELARAHPALRPVRLARNFGQSAAILAGFRAARGAWVAVLDADLQNPPAELARLWDALPGHDAALGWRLKRRDTWRKRIISKVANRVRHGVLGDTVRDTGCAVRIFPRAVALRLPMFRGAHRFFGPLLLREGCRIVQLPVEHRPRPHGRSNYNLWNRSLNVVVDLLGVAWLMRRPVRGEVRPLLDEPAAGPPPAMHARAAAPAPAPAAGPREG